MIIDLHAHTSASIMRNLHTTDASISYLEKMAQQYDISKIVLMATYFPLKGTGLNNYKLLERIKDNPLFSMFGSLEAGHHFDEGLVELTTLVKEDKIAGIKLYPGYQEFSPSEPKMYPLYQLALDYNLPVMFHGGSLHGCCPRDENNSRVLKCGFNNCKLEEFQYLSHPDQLRGMLKIFPQLKVVVSHLAKPYFKQLRNVMNEHTNVFTDISGQYDSGTAKATVEYKQIVVQEIKSFLNNVKNAIDRIAFATDFPIQSYEDTFLSVRNLNLDQESKEKIMYKNAQKILDKNWRI